MKWIRLVGSTYQNQPSVDEFVDNEYVKTYVNKTSMSMLSFIQSIAEKNGYHMFSIHGNSATFFKYVD